MSGHSTRSGPVSVTARRKTRGRAPEGAAARRAAAVVAGAIALCLLFLTTAPAAVLWTPGGVGICLDPAVQSEPVSCTDGAGGTIVAWTDERYGGMTGQDIYAQRFDSSGAQVWADDVDVCRATDGQDGPRIVADGSGGAIIAWGDYRSGDSDIYAQRLDSNGSVHAGWDNWGEQISVYSAWTQDDVELCSDQAGGAVICWRDFRNGNNDVYAQLIDGTGTRAWQNLAEPLLDQYDGMPVTQAALDQENSRITWSAVTQPGPVIAWEDDRDNTTSNLDIYAQKLNVSSGAPRWTLDGQAVYEDSGGAQLNQASPVIAGDGAGGAIVAWQDNRSGTYDIYGQRVNSAGTLQWSSPDGLVICGAANGQIEPAIVQRSDGAVVAWHDMRDDLGDIYAASVKSAGTFTWGPVIVCGTAGTQEVPVLGRNGTGGAVVAWTHLPSSDSDVYAQFLDSSGDPGLAANGVALCSAGGAQSDLCVATDGDGTAIVTWLDPSSDPDGDVWGQRVSTEYPAPTVTGITPSSAQDSGTVTITDLAGTGFRDGAQVKLSRSGEVDIVGTAVSVASSTKITCTFDLDGAAEGAWNVVVTNTDSKAGTLAGGFTVTETCYPTWYLAEGSTDWGYDTIINIQNPNSAAVTAAIEYQTKDGLRTRPDVLLPPNSQTTLNPRNDIGDTDFSTKVTCKEGNTIAVDRRMTWTGTGAASSEGHSSVGVTSPSVTWYLPEGSSKWGFECWLLIQNPNAAGAYCTVTYMIEGEGPVPVAKSVSPNSRATFNIADDIGQKDASIMVQSNVPVIPERAMYRNNRREGHDSIGTTAPATDFYLAEGTTDWGFTTYVLVQNPNASSANVSVTYMTDHGPVTMSSFSMPSQSRKTLRVNDFLPGEDLSTRVHSDQPIIAERAMYWDNGFGEACHDSIGMSSPHTAFYLPDGKTDGGFETWTLVQNPNDIAVSIEITYMTPGATGNKTQTDSVAASSRKTYFMADAIPAGTASVRVVSTTAGKPIMVERAMYWNTRGAGTSTIGGYSD